MTFPILTAIAAALLTLTYIATALRRYLAHKNDPANRDKRLITAAAAILDRTYDDRAGKCSEEGIRQATETLRKHSLPKHALSALTNERDRARLEQSERAMRELEQEMATRAPAPPKRKYSPPTIKTLSPGEAAKLFPPKSYQ